jgi:hypothetical protein
MDPFRSGASGTRWVDEESQCSPGITDAVIAAIKGASFDLGRHHADRERDRGRQGAVGHLKPLLPANLPDALARPWDRSMSGIHVIQIWTTSHIPQISGISGRAAHPLRNLAGWPNCGWSDKFFRPAAAGRQSVLPQPCDVVFEVVETK